MTKADAAILNINMRFITLKKLKKSSTFALSFLLLLSSCTFSSTKIQPRVEEKMTRCDIARLPSAFEPLSKEELQYDWAKELLVGEKFARELDFYRAITAFKRAIIFIGNASFERLNQIEYCIIECYFLAGKYCEALQEFEQSHLLRASAEFPAFRNLLIIIQECYDQLKEFEKSAKILEVIQSIESELANDLQLSIALREGDLISANALAGTKKEPVQDLASEYYRCRLSPKKAQMLNAILPGAGYYYVGQKKAASTSFIINALFIGASYYFFDTGNWPAGLITLSLETGWYIGGINGAGLEAKEYNERLYNCTTKGMMVRNNLFPFLMFETSF